MKQEEKSKKYNFQYDYINSNRVDRLTPDSLEMFLAHIKKNDDILLELNKNIFKYVDDSSLALRV